MAYLSMLIVFTLVQFSLCSPHSGEDHSSGEDHDISHEHDGWRNAPRTANRIMPPSLISPTLMNLLAMLANALGRQQTTPSADDCVPTVPSVRPSSQGPGQLRPSLPQSLQQPVLRPAQGLSEPHTSEKPSTQGPIQPQRPQGGWGVQLMDPVLNITQLLG